MAEGVHPPDTWEGNPDSSVPRMAEEFPERPVRLVVQEEHPALAAAARKAIHNAHPKSPPFLPAPPVPKAPKVPKVPKVQKMREASSHTIRKSV